MTPTQQIDEYRVSIKDWRGEYLEKLRTLVHAADSEITEEWKWGTPVFSHNGMVLAIGVFKDKVKVNFFKGAQLSEHQKLFNAGLDSKQQRSIDFSEDDVIDGAVIKKIIRSAVDLNLKK